MAESTTIARPYAQAAYSHAKEAGSVEQWQTFFQVLEALVQDEDGATVLVDPHLTHDARRKFVLDVAGSKVSVSDDMARMVDMLMENGRFPLCPEIYALFEEEIRADAGASRVTIISAKPMDEEQLAAIEAAIKLKYGEDCQVESEVDETLIGGAKIQVGDKVFDNSVKGQLAQLANELTQQR